MKNVLIKKMHQHLPSIISVSLSLLLCALVYYIFYFHSVAYVHLIVEDSWGEYGTFMCYLLSFFILLWAMAINPNLRKPGYIVLALCFFIMAMEEVSWLQRILDIKTPGELMVINNQDELNFHNIKYVKHTKKIFSYLISFWALILPFMHKQYKTIKEAVKKIGIPLLPFYLIPVFVLALFFFIAMPIPKFDEINELIFAIGFILFAMHLLLYSYKNTPVFSTIQKAAPVVLLSIIFFTTGLLSSKWPYAHDLKWRFNQFASEIYYANEKYDQAASLYKYILNNPELINESTLYNYALYLNKTGQNTEARKALTKALMQQENFIKLHPHEVQHHIAIAKIYNALNDQSKSLEHFKTAIDIYTRKINTTKEPSQRSRLYLEQGDIYILSRQYHKAADNYRMALSAASSKKERDMTIRHVQNSITMNLQYPQGMDEI